MMHIMKPQTLKDLGEGEPAPLGACLKPDGVNFALYSRHAQDVFLLLFDSPQGPPTDTIKLKRTGDVWHTFVKGLKAGQFYGYKVLGEYDPGGGNRFNPCMLLLDPYAKALSGKFTGPGSSMFPYDIMTGDDTTAAIKDNMDKVPKCIVIDDAFDWRNDRPPRISMDHLIIYEVHVKGFTAHPSAQVAKPGTYLGFIEKIPYLKKLGINAVELMPVHEFFLRNELRERGLTEYWGYNTIGFFAPEVSYSTQSSPGCQVTEFKTLVRELHKAGIEVLLDVVYNHTGEGDHLGPSVCFKGIDNRSYYSLTANANDAKQPWRFYINDTGCGNTLNIESPVVLAMVLDSLRYWVQVMHVDGFRFDLATVLGKVNRAFTASSQFFEAVAKDPILNKTKFIAEPWDMATYQLGQFPPNWSEWNGKFRDTTRRFLKGDEGQVAETAKRLTGSADLFEHSGRKPCNSVNYVTCHDGFTLLDLYSYNEKHNEANGEENRDGTNENYSWNCGAEGQTTDLRLAHLRKQMIKNAFCSLLFSSGTPMILYGDEMMRSQSGNNNAYCHDNEQSWLNWENLEKHHEIFDFCAKAITFRKSCSLIRRREFFNGSNPEGGAPDIAWFDRNLKSPPPWGNPLLRFICFQLAGHEAPLITGDYYLMFIFNMNYRAAMVHLPQFEGLRWYRLVDTCQKPGEDFRLYDKRRLLRRQDRHYCAGRTVSVLWAGI